MMKFSFVENEKSFLSEIKTIFQILQVFPLRLEKQTSKNVADTTFNFLKILCIQGFLNGIKWWGGISPSWGNGKFYWGEFIFWLVATWGGVILTIQTFFKARSSIL